MLVYLRDGFDLIIVHAATLRQKMQIRLAISLSHSLLTPGKPFPALALEQKTPGRVVNGVTINVKSLV